tara:strand:+ start:1440 stop:1586 length:147 start_codon:yes stop_codon:yes gene_type:complete
MNKQQIKERINYLNMELAHSHYHDGWVLNGMREELSKLKKKLDLNSKK